MPQIEFSAVELGVRQSERLLMMLDAGVRDEIQSTLTGWTRPSHDLFFEQPRAITVGELEQSELDDGSQVYVSGILSAYSEKAYSKGIMGRMEIQDTAGSLQGVIWEEQRAKAKEAGDIPPTGFPVVLCGRLETRTFTIQAAPEDAEVSVDVDDGGEQQDNEAEITRRQIMVKSVYPIGVDLSPTGFMPAAPFPNINLTGETVVVKESAEEIESIKQFQAAAPERVEAVVHAPVLVAAGAVHGAEQTPETVTMAEVHSAPVLIEPLPAEPVLAPTPFTVPEPVVEPVLIAPPLPETVAAPAAAAPEAPAAAVSAGVGWPKLG